MSIPINLCIPGSSSGCTRLPPQLAQFGTDEVVLIELQGALEADGNKDGQLVGKLRVDSSTKKPTLMIGHHLLEGKLVNLPKPLAVLRRHDASTSPGADHDNDIVMESDDPDPKPRELSGANSWDIVAVVKRKMVFSKRPMPIVGKPFASAPLSRVGSKV